MRKRSVCITKLSNLILISLPRMPQQHICFCRRKAFGWIIDREQEVAEARRLARRAVQLGKDDATVLCFAGYALAYVVGDLDDGAAFLDRALLINPNLASGWSYSGWVKVWLGEPDRAIEHFAHAMRLSPIDPGTRLYASKGRRMLISLLAGMMKHSHGQRWHCESCRIATAHCVSLPQAVRLLGVTRKRRD